MASKVPVPQTDPNYLSPEECRERFGSFLSADPKSMQIRIPDWHIELLKERMERYCKYGVHVTPWDDFEKKLLNRLKELKQLMKD